MKIAAKAIVKTEEMRKSVVAEKSKLKKLRKAATVNVR